MKRSQTLLPRLLAGFLVMGALTLGPGFSRAVTAQTGVSALAPLPPGAAYASGNQRLFEGGPETDAASRSGAVHG